MAQTYIELPMSLVLILIIKNSEVGSVKNIKQEKIYMFIGLIPKNAKRYEYLQKCGFILIFKETISVGKVVKGNCDAELVLKTVSDFYTKAFNTCIIITGDGDFGCLVEFLHTNKVLAGVLAPNKQKCSFLLRNKEGIELTFLNEHYHKFSRPLN